MKEEGEGRPGERQTPEPSGEVPAGRSRGRRVRGEPALPDRCLARALQRWALSLGGERPAGACRWDCGRRPFQQALSGCPPTPDGRSVSVGREVDGLPVGSLCPGLFSTWSGESEKVAEPELVLGLFRKDTADRHAAREDIVLGRPQIV